MRIYLIAQRLETGFLHQGLSVDLGNVTVDAVFHIIKGIGQYLHLIVRIHIDIRNIKTAAGQFLCAADHIQKRPGDLPGSQIPCDAEKQKA